MIDKNSYKFFRNFANPLRVEIINLLLKKKMYVNEISKSLGVEQSKVSHALSHLRKNGIVSSHCVGKKRIYRLNKKAVLPILKYASNFIKNNSHEPEC